MKVFRGSVFMLVYVLVRLVWVSVWVVSIVCDGNVSSLCS